MTSLISILTLFVAAAINVSVLRASPILPTPKATHVFMEAARPVAARKDLIRSGRAPADADHEVIFVTQQRNLDQLEAAALDVSNPASANYGKYWTTEQIDALTANDVGRDAIVTYLRAEGVSVHNVTTHGEFIVAYAPVHVFESMFDTQFYNHYYAVEGT
jgi:tripeptidyl-peptidase-1